MRVTLASGRLHVTGDGVDFDVALADVAVDAPLGNLPRALRLPDGGRLLTEDRDTVAQWFPQAHQMESWVHRLERHWHVALAALLVLAALTGVLVVYGLPLAAEKAAQWLPDRVQVELGERTLATLEQVWCGPTDLPPARQAALQQRFRALSAGLPGLPARLELRDCGVVGPNAFALPGGLIVMTDALVALADADPQLDAVLAHELGHQHHQHALRFALQAAGVSVLVATLTSDASSVSSLTATLPAVLVTAGYSREFETEADTYAYARLRATGQSPVRLAEILAKLRDWQREEAGKAADEEDDAPGYLDSHPGLGERIVRARSER